MSYCIIWKGATRYGGYGVQYDPVKKKQRGAHVMAYEKVHGLVPRGSAIDHLCKNPCCVNPDHLEMVTPQKNSANNKGTKYRVLREHIPWSRRQNQIKIIRRAK
jgi:hypothetical protein